MKGAAFLKSRSARIVSVVLLLQMAAFYSLSHGESVPLIRPLSDFPAQLGSWHLVQTGVIEQEIKDQLRADDYLTRFYEMGNTREVANLYIAYFKSQRTGQTPHSPKNCLPGTGWVPSTSAIISVAVPGEAQPVRVNEYIVAKGESKSAVLYWYQSHGRVVASEYRAKFWVVADALRYNRTDTALVRVVVPITDNQQDAATSAALDFVRAFFEPLRSYLPS